jgi:hypothetical protein
VKGIDTTLKVFGILCVLSLFIATMYNGLISAFADSSNPLTNKEEFDVVVSGISHKSILVSVSIDGLTQKFTIHGNPRYISAPTVQTIVFKFARNLGATPPTALPIKIGDIWTACISLAKDTHQSSCTSLPVTSLTQPQKQGLDARYIPGQKSGVRPAALAPLG